MHLTVKYPEEMSRTNKKGRTLRQIIESGAAYRHYAYLQNGSVLLNNFSECEREHMNIWTVSNEALHNQIKTALRTVTLQHEDSLKTKVHLFAMDNMLAHSSAAYQLVSAQRCCRIWDCGMCSEITLWLIRLETTSNFNVRS